MKRNPILLILYIMLSLGIMVLIFSLSGDSGSESSALSDWVKDRLYGALNTIFPDLFVSFITTNIRKIAHFTIYLCLGITTSLSLTECYLIRRPDSVIPVFAFGIPWNICILYAITDEIHQRFVPGRCGCIKDVLIDALGALVGCTVIYFFTLLFQKKGNT